MSFQNPVRQLNAETARKIAAGEVIDRPNAIVRELMDNSIDSGATYITVEVNGGGVDKIRLIDNGCGLTREDLETCAHPHCTSKISTDTDLLNLTTLGFRGEALASIAAVSRLSIISGGWKMRASITEDHIIEPFQETNGTIVQSEGLFENFPARRQFLKRPASEGLLCKNTFIEKCLPRPDIAFRLILDGETKLNLQKDESLTNRFVRAMNFRESEKLFYEISNQEADWKFRIIIGEPSVNRSNKKDIYIFINGRKIQEYSLVQAVEYGSQGYFPNGTYPVAAVFVDMNPAMVDFNIHPAKKEARFSDISSLHHGISSTVRNFYKNHTIQNLASNALSSSTGNSQITWNERENQLTREGNKKAFESLFDEKSFYDIPSHSVKNTDFRSQFLKSPEEESKKYAESKISVSETLPKTSSAFKDNNHDGFLEKTVSQALNLFTAKTPSKTLGTQQIQENTPAEKKDNDTQNSNHAADSQISCDDDFRFLGSTLGTFLVAEKNGSLFIIDKHAAHERILFNQIMAEKPGKVTLLIPYTIETESEADNNYLFSIQNRLSESGFDIIKVGENKWEVNTTADRWKGSQKDFIEAVMDNRVEPEEIIRSIAAMTACKAAAKDGYILDDKTAAQIAREALTLPDPHCPHGRPVYVEFSREKLFLLVNRT